ncbi:MAG: penicillin-binding protein 1C [Prevotella sp.]|jgi:penicillin-binding protein 1C|nr:penicillin-binding protein 1C [Prevotella sp.]
MFHFVFRSACAIFADMWNTIKHEAQRLWKKYAYCRMIYKAGIPVAAALLLWYVFCLPAVLFDVPYSTVVTDRNGELLGARIAADQQWRFPDSSSVPEKYAVCLLEFEDRYFRLHWGVNPLSMARAAWQNAESGRVVSGASTITMQTVRLARKEKRTFAEKIIEMIWATRLEFSCTKNEILNLYASHAPMGANVVGVSAASWRYFGHDAATLSWAEAATLAVLPNSPSMIHPGRNRNRLLEKRNRLLGKLYRRNVLDKTTYDLAVEEPLLDRPFPLPQIASHLVTRLYLEQPGQHIRSTIDKQRQLQIEQILNRWNAEFSQNGIHNIAALVIDLPRNEVAAYCGNVHFDKSISANQVDVIQSPRSTGSILKPFLYCAMLQEGALLPHQLLPDVPVNINGFTPKNFSLQYDGAAPASQALARSLNVPFVVSLRKYGVAKFRNLLVEAGMTTITRSADNYGLSLILGGAEGKLWDITCMYARMGQTLNDYLATGAYRQRPPVSYLYGENDEEEEEETISKPLFSAGAIWQTLEALTNVNRPEELDWRTVPSMQKIAWKTGTSFGFRDGWAIGISPRYAVGVWVGNSDGEGRPGLVGARTAGMAMFDIFNCLPASRWFGVPSGDLTKAETCRESGFLRGLSCPDALSDTALVCPKGLDAAACPFHREVNLSEDMKYQVYNNCAGGRGIVHTQWFVLPASWALYYREQHPAYRPLPPFSPECAGNAQDKVMEFIYPFPYAVVSLPKQLDGSDGEMVFELACRLPEKRVFWHLDNSYIGETQQFHRKAARPPKGIHKLTVVDEDGNTAAVSFTVK